MNDETKPKGRGGRPRQNPEAVKPPALSFRARDGLRAKLEAGAKAADRSISEEIERMLGLAYDLAANPVDDFMVRTILNAVRSSKIVTGTDWRENKEAGQLTYASVSAVLSMIFAQSGTIELGAELDELSRAAGYAVGLREFNKAVGKSDEVINDIGSLAINDFVRRDVHNKVYTEVIQKIRNRPEIRDRLLAAEDAGQLDKVWDEMTEDGTLDFIKSEPTEPSNVVATPATPARKNRTGAKAA